MLENAVHLTAFQRKMLQACSATIPTFWSTVTEVKKTETENRKACLYFLHFP